MLVYIRPPESNIKSQENWGCTGRRVKQQNWTCLGSTQRLNLFSKTASEQAKPWGTWTVFRVSGHLSSRNVINQWGKKGEFNLNCRTRDAAVPSENERMHSSKGTTGRAALAGWAVHSHSLLPDKCNPNSSELPKSPYRYLSFILYQNAPLDNEQLPSLDPGLGGIQQIFVNEEMMKRKFHTWTNRCFLPMKMLQWQQGS